MKLTKVEIARRRENTRQTLASLRLEGIEPSKGMIDDLELLDIGQITPDEFTQRGLIRARSMRKKS